MTYDYTSGFIPIFSELLTLPQRIIPAICADFCKLQLQRSGGLGFRYCLMEKNTMTKHRVLFRLTVFVFLAFALSGLSSCIGLKSFLGGKVEVRAVVSPKANLNNSVEVDVLLVYDEELLKELLKMTSKDWFAKREQIRQDASKDTGFESWQWEWTPGQQISPQFIALKSKAKACLIFANYFTPGAHRVKTDPHESFFLNFDEKDFTIEPIR